MSKSKREDDLDKLASLHPKFLETLKKVYPLAVLGSLGIAISAFSHQSFPELQMYSLGSATMFLFAFVFSFSYEASKFTPFSLFSYIATALAILLLFCTIFEFSTEVPLIHRAYSSFLTFLGAMVLSSMYYSSARLVRKICSKVARSVMWVTVSSGILTVAFIIIGQVDYILSGRYGIFENTLVAFPVSFVFVTSLVFLFVSVYIVWRERKPRNRASPTTQGNSCEGSEKRNNIQSVENSGNID